MPKPSAGRSVIGCVSALLFASDQVFVLFSLFCGSYFRHKSICCNSNIFATRLPPNWRNWLPKLEGETFGANKCEPTCEQINQAFCISLSLSLPPCAQQELQLFIEVRITL